MHEAAEKAKREKWMEMKTNKIKVNFFLRFYSFTSTGFLKWFDFFLLGSNGEKCRTRNSIYDREISKGVNGLEDDSQTRNRRIGITSSSEDATTMRDFKRTAHD